MDQNLSGSEFVAKVASTLGQELKNQKLVAFLYETCRNNGLFSAFKDLALYAKSFQKVARLLSTDRVGDDTKNKARTELEEFINEFSDLVEAILSRLPDEKGREVRTNFLIPTQESFMNLRSLLNDFAAVKDYFLDERDRNKNRQQE